MIESAVGTDNFFNALKIYLDDNKYKTATHYDLIAAFEKVGAKN